MKIGNFILPRKVNRLAVTVIQVHPAEILHLILAHQVMPELILADENGRIVVEEQVKDRDIISITIVPQTNRFLPQLHHHIPVETNENFWGCEFSCLFDLIYHIFNPDINIL